MVAYEVKKQQGKSKFANSSACQSKQDMRFTVNWCKYENVFSNLQVVAGAAWAVYRLMQDTPV